ncbi:MAG: PDZ domain-containing protein [Dehalococcoidia bacterium]|nr:PDZ domain-containing protein [Dehalococcoidia bacterium]
MMKYRVTLLAPVAALVVAVAVACTPSAPAKTSSPALSEAAAPAPITQQSPAATLLSANAAAATPPNGAQPQPGKVIPSTLNTVEIVKLLRPSVVHVQTELVAGLDRLGRPATQTAIGTGSIVDGQGRILTNNHVVEGARKITVALDDGRTFTARLIGADPLSDLAVIKIDADNLTPVRLGDSDALQVGEDVVAIGFALDLEGGASVTKGVVSALERSVDSLEGLIQTDTDINPGNSGGPLANSRGEVVGVNTRALRGSPGSIGGPEAQGINFAISINQAKAIMQSILEKGHVVRSYLGVNAVTVTPATARSFNLPVERGVVLQSVAPNTPASRAGLQANDIIVAMDGKAISNFPTLLRLLTVNPPGAKVNVEYFRGTEKRSADLTLGERPAQ